MFIMMILVQFYDYSLERIIIYTEKKVYNFTVPRAHTGSQFFVWYGGSSEQMCFDITIDSWIAVLCIVWFCVRDAQRSQRLCGGRVVVVFRFRGVRSSDSLLFVQFDLNCCVVQTFFDPFFSLLGCFFAVNNHRKRLCVCSTVILYVS